MLVTTKEMLLDAQKNHYAVGAFNVENLEFVMAVLAAAEETKSPVIMQTDARHHQDRRSGLLLRHGEGRGRARERAGGSPPRPRRRL